MAGHEGIFGEAEVVVDGVDVCVTDAAVGDGDPDVVLSQFRLFEGEGL